jgi:cytochrome c
MKAAGDRRQRRTLALIGASLPALAALAGNPPPVADPPAAGCDAARAERVLAQCTICHSTARDEPHLAGPNLYGVVGRPAASAQGFAYSKALRALGIDWTPAELDRFLAAPMTAVPGTAMAFGGLRNAADRAALICRLAQLR